MGWTYGSPRRYSGRCEVRRGSIQREARGIAAHDAASHCAGSAQSHYALFLEARLRRLAPVPLRHNRLPPDPAAYALPRSTAPKGTRLKS